MLDASASMDARRNQFDEAKMSQHWRDMVIGDALFSGTAEGEAVDVFDSGYRGTAPVYGDHVGQEQETLYVIFPDDRSKLMHWPIGWRSWTAEQRQSRLEDESLIDLS